MERARSAGEFDRVVKPGAGLVDGVPEARDCEAMTWRSGSSDHGSESGPRNHGLNQILDLGHYRDSTHSTHRGS